MTPAQNPIRERAKHWAMAWVLTCTSGLAQALSLGHFSLESSLGQPLRAAIEITQYKVEDLRRIKVQLAEPGSFEQAGMVFHPALAGLQARLEFRGDGKPFIALTGLLPVNEHFLDVIVEVQWPSGRLAMNYTLLLSPVGVPTARPGKPNPDGTPNPLIPPVVSPQALGLAALSAPDNRNQSTEENLRVRSGDTASKLALQKLPAGVTLDQMLLAMVRANPEAFIEGNVHLLREGAQIQLPNAQQAAEVSAEEARLSVIAQSVDFASYARRVAQSTQKASDTASREVTGKVADVQAPEPVAPAQDKLTLSKREVATDSAEARLAVEREIQDKTEQLAALKKNLETLKSLSATPDPAATLPAESQALQPVVPLAAAQANAGPLLEQISRNPSVWAWVLALLTGMGVLVAWVRRRPASQEDLFGDHSATAQAPKLAPFAAGLPPQFADLDLNLTPVAASPTGPKPDIRADIPADLQAGIQADAQKVVRHESPAANPPGSPK